jgi:DNA polymerase-1
LTLLNSHCELGQVWHNYSFDRAMFGNHGIDVRGFGGDTMHMARLWSAARIRGYSLEALSKDLTSSSKVIRRPCSVLSSGRVLALCRSCFLIAILVALVRVADCGDLQIPMKQRFGRNRLRKDGTPGKIVELPSIVELHSSVRFSLAAILRFAPFKQFSSYITTLIAHV